MAVQIVLINRFAADVALDPKNKGRYIPFVSEICDSIPDLQRDQKERKEKKDQWKTVRPTEPVFQLADWPALLLQDC